MGASFHRLSCEAARARRELTSTRRRRFVFAGCNIAGAVIVYFFLYESSGLSLENVDRMYNDPSVKPWTSRSWVPPVRPLPSSSPSRASLRLTLRAS